MEENSNVTTTTITTESHSKKNDWKVLSGILAVVVIALLVYMFLGKGITGHAISEKDANAKVIDYLNSRTGGGVTSVSTKDIGNLYEVTVSYQGNDIPVYVKQNLELTKRYIESIFGREETKQVDLGKWV